MKRSGTTAAYLHDDSRMNNTMQYGTRIAQQKRHFSPSVSINKIAKHTHQGIENLRDNMCNASSATQIVTCEAENSNWDDLMM